MPQRKPVIAGNWKMFKLLDDAVRTALELKPLAANSGHCEVAIAPVFTALKTVADRLEGTNIKVAAQNCSSESEFGARTGEVSAAMLTDIGCSHVILGHSERRHIYGESDVMLNKKLKAALLAGLTPMFCVGEQLVEREAGSAHNVVLTQLLKGLEGLTPNDMGRIIIAYEPVWAIGTGKTATPEQAQEMHGYIREVIGHEHGSEVSGSLRILYGGSVKPGNIAAIMEQPDVDGALVGGASLEADSFAKIVNYR